ncbi:MAG TPA: hypothetical protein DIT10_17760 [Chryseobacterium sp.]|nr:hypothetical protein [Chryseobacterium sp.]
MKKKAIILLIIIFSHNVFSQVGINTTNPKSTLDVSAKRNSDGTLNGNSQIFGLQAPRITRLELTNNTTNYGTNQNGSLIYITDVSGGTATGEREFITSIGYYYFDASTDRWVRFVTKIPSNWELDNIYDYEATAAQDITNSGTDLTGFSKAITIPANKDAKIVISYSMPVGTTINAGYYGVTLMKGNNEFIAGSRKYTNIQFPTTGASWAMVTVSATVSDNIEGTTASQTITYSLKAYLENLSNARFAMYANQGANFNWGHGYWSIIVYLRDKQ